MKFQYDRHFKTKIKDDVWECYLITSEEIVEVDSLINKTDPSDPSEGLVYLEEKCLFINEEHLTKRTLTHELFHVMVFYLHLSSTEIDRDEFEEIIAVFLEYELEKFIRIRNRLFNKFTKLIGVL